MPLLAKEIADRVLSSQTREAEVLRVQEALKAPEMLQNRQIIEAWAILGEASMWQKEAEKCEQAYLHCVNIIVAMQDNVLLSECYTDLGNALYYCEAYEKAFRYYNEAAIISQRLQNHEWLALILSQMARCCADMGLLQQERVYLGQALELPIDILIKATLLERLGISYANSGQYTEAAKYYEEALSSFENNNFKRYWEDRIDGLIKIYLALGDENAVQRTMKRK